MNVLAIIPARSGSKGIKDKNIKDLCGKPLISYTIDAAIKSKVFKEIMVSTDSVKYKSISLKYGAKVPFLRSKKNATDKANMVNTIKEVLKMYEEQGMFFDAFCILQPTSPLRTATDIQSAYKMFKSKSKVAVVAVTETDHSPLWCNTLQKDLSLDGFISKNIINRRRQDISKFYRVNGAIYFMYIKAFMKDSNFYRKGSCAYIMDKKHSVDIDTYDDFEYVKYILETIS